MRAATLLLAVLPTTTFAGTPTITVASDGTIVGVVTVAAPPSDAQRWLSDPVWVTNVDGGGTQVTVTGHDGACLLADYRSPSTIVNVEYSVRQCPSAAGVVSTLVTSNAFNAYRTEWKVEPSGVGSKLTYKLYMDSKLFVPESLIQSTARKAVEKLMTRMSAAMGG